MLNSKNFSLNGGTGSAKDYFEEMSMGQFTPTFDVYGPYTLPNTYKYYGANDQYGDDLHPGQLIMEVCKLADDDINYADYDFDGDGYVDNVYVFYAGTGEASSYVENDIWPHQYTLSEWNYYDKDVEPITCDGKIVDRYACSNEVTDGAPSGVGTFVHEFSHVMGLPDLYVTTVTDHNCTPGYFSVLDYGPYNNDGHTPPAYGAYERNAMGWIDLDEFDGSDTYTLENIATSNKAYVVETSREKEFYLFENRQLTGWDAYIPNHGMMIWHIDATSQQIFDNNIPNNNQSHQYVAVVKPNGEENMDYASGWTWPGTSGKTAFSSSTTPAFKDWKNVASEKALANIAETNGIISFDVTMPLPVPTPDAENLIKKGDDYFYASWKTLKDATDYRLWVYTAKYPTDDDAVTVTADMGTDTTFKLPDGWTSSGVAATSSYYGEAAPGAKFSAKGSYIQTPAYEYDVCGISLWYEGLNTGSTASISVQGLIDGAWTVLETISLSDTEIHAGYTVSNIPNGVKQVRLTFNKISNGTLVIDDVVIVTKPTVKYNVLPGYDGVSTSGNNSVLVNNLVEGCDTYAFCVAATADGKNYTDASEIRAVNLGATSGVHGVAVDAAEGLRVSVNNRTVSVSTSAERVEVFNIVGHHISSVRVSDNSAVIDLPTSGMYIVRAGNSTAKVVVR
jgi:M6 family metalloprotease-like protein